MEEKELIKVDSLEQLEALIGSEALENAVREVFKAHDEIDYNPDGKSEYVTEKNEDVRDSLIAGGRSYLYMLADEGEPEYFTDFYNYLSDVVFEEEFPYFEDSVIEGLANEVDQSIYDLGYEVDAEAEDYEQLISRVGLRFYEDFTEIADEVWQTESRTYKEQHAKELAEQAEKMLDPKGHVVLERYGDDALIYRGPNIPEPYVCAYGYDENTGEWSHGTYFVDVAKASHHLNPEVIEEMTVVWEREDIREHMEYFGHRSTDDGFLHAFNEIMFGLDFDWIVENTIESTNSYIESVVNSVTERIAAEKRRDEIMPLRIRELEAIPFNEKGLSEAQYRGYPAGTSCVDIAEGLKEDYGWSVEEITERAKAHGEEWACNPALGGFLKSLERERFETLSMGEIVELQQQFDVLVEQGLSVSEDDLPGAFAEFCQNPEGFKQEHCGFASRRTEGDEPPAAASFVPARPKPTPGTPGEAIAALTGETAPAQAHSQSKERGGR